ncbi:MAG: RNA polymerase factor sigma-54 [Thermodesulfovibrionales bacterium]|nr:RNA polymerase factor sigma-54 [Thermodesulfovibrionales bacterium]
MENRLELKLLQKLILTPQLQLAIKLLQLPQLELSQTLSQELMENPFLEETVEEAPEEGSNEAETEEAEEYGVKEDAEINFEKLAPSSVDDYFEERGLDGRDLGYFTPGHVAPPTIESSAGGEAGLSEHLLWQLRFSDAPQRIRDIAEIVIGNLDDNGYLRASDEEIAAAAECPAGEALEAVLLVQTFDPRGVAARDLKECLILQVDELGLRGSLVEEIINHNLGDLEKKRYKQVAAQHGCSLDSVLHAVKVIESLEPKPGRNFSTLPSIYIAPDVFITKTGKDYQIILNDENIPSLRINGYYRKLLMNKNSLPKEERQYLEEKLRSAVWLLKSLDHRYKTIYRVSESILNFQRAFFDGGVSAMKPMNLRVVAADLAMHESTISRATANKYLSCSHGLFNFRYFFSSGISSDSGMVSSTSVKEIIRKIVSEENTLKPLSDQKIVELLKGQHITAARRTVAKYRDELRIPPQIQRKKFN